MKILFVCYANITRSFMAERVLKSTLKGKMRFDVGVASAGLIDMKGSAADPGAADILIKNGFDASGHRSRLLTGEMLDEADKVLVMEESHARTLRVEYPGAKDKIHLLKSFSTHFNAASNGDIRDCHKKSNYHYRLCFAEIYEAIQGLTKCI